MIAQRVFDALLAEKLKLATAESCTGGMVAAAITDIAGSSQVFDCGFVTYSNEAKTNILSVPAALIAEHGAVSREVAEAMAIGALARSRADISVSITGIAGPFGGSVQKPVGLVHFACATKAGALVHVMKQFGSKTRPEIRSLACDEALALVLNVALPRQTDASTLG